MRHRTPLQVGLSSDHTRTGIQRLEARGVFEPLHRLLPATPPALGKGLPSAELDPGAPFTRNKQMQSRLWGKLRTKEQPASLHVRCCCEMTQSPSGQVHASAGTRREEFFLGKWPIASQNLTLTHTLTHTHRDGGRREV